jgi:signal transduction histidine kinase
MARTSSKTATTPARADVADPPPTSDDDMPAPALPRRKSSRQDERIDEIALKHMTHELRTPLNAIMGFAQLLLDPATSDAPLTPAQAHQVEHILRAGQHLLEVIDATLDLSALEAGTLPLHLEPLDPSAVIGEAIAFMEPLIVAKHQCVALAITPDTPLVLADRVRLRQMVINLLSNAIKYSPESGIITIGAHPASCHMVECFVQDSGPGIPKKYQQAIFHPFFQAPAGSRRDHPSGTGLGLAIVQQLAERHGGSAGVLSARGHGSTFWVRLPAAE